MRATAMRLSTPILKARPHIRYLQAHTKKKIGTIIAFIQEILIPLTLLALLCKKDTEEVLGILINPLILKCQTKIKQSDTIIKITTLQPTLLRPIVGMDIGHEGDKIKVSLNFKIA